MRTLTLRGVPDELISALKREAADSRRSLNGQAVLALDQRFSSSDEEEDALMKRINHFVEELEKDGVWILPEDVDRWIDEGRD